MIIIGQIYTMTPASHEIVKMPMPNGSKEGC